MKLVEEYIATAKEMKKLDHDSVTYWIVWDQLVDMWEDMSEKEQAQASTIYNELWPQG